MQNFVKLRISVSGLKDISVCLLVVAFSMILGHFYREGDQMHYIAAYDAIENAGLFNGFLIYKSHVTTEEPIHFFISWIFSSLIGMNKLLAMSLSNGLLAFLLIKLVRKLGGSLSVAYVFVLTNYYFWVMYLTAERLKFSFIFLLLTLLTLGRPKATYILFSISILAHLQMLILLLAREFERFSQAVFRFLTQLSVSKRFLRYFVAILILALVFLYYFVEYLLWKIPQYIKGGDLSSLWQVTLFMFLTLFFVKNWWRTILFFIPIGIASLVVGPERVVIIAYFVFFYYAVQYRRGLNYGIGLTTLYFGLKSIGFIFNILSTGQGFDG